MADVYQGDGSEPGKSAGAEVTFFCSCCGARMTAPADLKGRTTYCLNCLRESPVPVNPLSSGEFPHPESIFEKESILSLHMRFLCPHCDNKLGVDARAGGRHADCPRCGRDVRVPLLPGLVTPDPPPPDMASTPGEAQGQTVLSQEEIQFLSTYSRGQSDG